MRIAIGSDHAGFKLKGIIEQRFSTSAREFTDFGVNTPQPVDYPDIAAAVGEAVARGDYDQGILVCGTGIGMAITANKVPGIRAALCHDIFTAKAAREHNDANILTLGERVLQPEVACSIVDAWLQARFAGGRHARRLEKIGELEKKYKLLSTEDGSMDYIEKYVLPVDPEVAAAIAEEEQRQEHGLELIASENDASGAVMAAQGSVMTNKYAEGYPGHRYYGGCANVDVVEDLARRRAGEIFGAEHVNVQPRQDAGQHGGIPGRAQARRTHPGYESATVGI